MFWRFSVSLFFISLIFPFVFSLLAMPLLGIVAALPKKRSPNEGTTEADGKRSVFAYPLIALIFIGFVYILCGWSAYVAARVLIYSSQPIVTHKWVYYVTGFMLCHGPLGYMAAKEGREGSMSSLLHVSIAMATFILFCIWPRLMAWPYGWFLNLIY